MNSTSQNHQDHQKQGRSEKLSQASLVAQTVKNLPAVQETKVQSLVWEDSLEKEMQPSLVSLPGESHGQRSLAGQSMGSQNVGHD